MPTRNDLQRGQVPLSLRNGAVWQHRLQFSSRSLSERQLRLPFWIRSLRRWLLPLWNMLRFGESCRQTTTTKIQQRTRDGMTVAVLSAGYLPAAFICSSS